MWFHGRQLIRRVEDGVKYVGTVKEKSQQTGQKMFKDLTKKMFLYESSDGNSSVGDLAHDRRPAEEWLEEEQEERRPWVPPELRYLLNSFHMFGQFDPAVFAEVSLQNKNLLYLVLSGVPKYRDTEGLCRPVPLQDRRP